MSEHTTPHATHTALRAGAASEGTPRRRLGQTDMHVSPVGLGCMGMSEFYGTTLSEADGIALIHHALDAGMNFFDTADMYGPHTNETLLGRALKGRRDEAIVATKFGIVRGEDRSLRGLNGRPDYVKAACDASLQRLGIDTIDLYYQHRVDPDVPVEETVGAMAELVTAGKVRALGLSEATDDQLRRAHAVHPITALQTEYSLFSRDPEADVLATCKALGITFVAYSPLSRGFLSGAIRSPDDFADDDFRKTQPRFSPENFGHNLALLDTLSTMAKTKGCTPAQLAIAWVLRAGTHVVTIPGTTKTHRFDENIAAGTVELSDADMAALEAHMPVKGARYG